MKRTFTIEIERVDGKDNDFDSSDIDHAIRKEFYYSFAYGDKATVRVTEQRKAA